MSFIVILSCDIPISHVFLSPYLSEERKNLPRAPLFYCSEAVHGRVSKSPPTRGRRIRLSKDARTRMEGSRLQSGERRRSNARWGLTWVWRFVFWLWFPFPWLWLVWRIFPWLDHHLRRSMACLIIILTAATCEEYFWVSVSVRVRQLQ